METNASLVRKYNVPVPRYTSYPTVPFWKDRIDGRQWQSHVRQKLSAATAEGISLYVHLPFCESLCTYCGCNKKITTRHEVEAPYLKAVLREWSQYRALMDKPPVIREIHLGGGTPTFFSPGHLTTLVEGLLKEAIIHPHHEFSFEGHPNNTARAHLGALFALGFRRVSYGVQDLNPEVQRIINRVQPFENVRRATEMARAVGFSSVNFDLIYGLPRQNEERLVHTVQQSVSLRPDRIAFYSYAHVPWTSRGQRLFDEGDLPGADEKLALYERGRRLFAANGYADIGMDHFALPGDELYAARESGTLHRNFMGYTSRQSDVLVGLGVSAISDMGDAFAQNSKTLAGYYEAIGEARPAIEKGYFSDEEDTLFRRHILDIACKGETQLTNQYRPLVKELVMPVLAALQEDGLVTLEEDLVRVTALGRSFLRNICSAFDLRLLRGRAQGAGVPLFSKAV